MEGERRGRKPSSRGSGRWRQKGRAGEGGETKRGRRKLGGDGEAACVRGEELRYLPKSQKTEISF